MDTSDNFFFLIIIIYPVKSATEDRGLVNGHIVREKRLYNIRICRMDNG